MRKKFTLRRIFNYFLGGLLIVLPLAATAWVIIISFNFLDGIIPTQTILGKSVPGLGVLVVLTAITFIGFIGEGFIVKPMLDLIDHLLEKTPGIKIIYSSVKDLMEAFVGEKKKFSEAVAVEMSGGIYKLGFITQKDLKVIGFEGFVAVYFPHSYNFSGNLFLVPAERIKPIAGNSSELMKFIVSGGVTEIGSASDKRNENK